MKTLKLRGDKIIWMLVVFFAMLSVIAVYSSSSILSNESGMEKSEIFLNQITNALIGFGALLLCYLIPLGWYRKLAFVAFGASLTLLIMTFIPGFQDIKNGAVRGVKLFGFSFQVFEFAKIGLILYLARALEKWEDSLDTLKDFCLKLFLPMVAVCLLVMANSFSSALLFGLISLLLMWFMGVRFKYLLFTLGVAFAALLMMFSIYHIFFAGKETVPGAEQSKVEKIFNRFGTAEHRVTSFFDDIKNPEEDDEENLTPAEKQKKLDEKRQSENAKIAISEGGLFGKGPGKSTQRFSLSWASSDFIYAFIVEEYGLLGGIFVLMLYTIFLFRSIRIGSRCRTVFSGALVIGLGFLIAIQAMLHIYVNVRLMPVTGHTLPLISHGGTAFVVLSAAFGIILSVSRKVDSQEEEERLALEAQNAENIEENNTNE